MRTVKDNIQFVDSAFHLATYVLNIVSKAGHFLTHTMRGLQVLYSHYPTFLLC